MADNNEVFKQHLVGKKLPVLTLDNKWYQLYARFENKEEFIPLVDELNELVKKQGKLTTELKNVRRLKTKLMDDIVSEMNQDESDNKKQEEFSRLISECNDKMKQYQDDLLDIPKDIESINYNLMMLTMKHCYINISSNSEDIASIGEWITNIRIELKKNIIRKQEMEFENQQIYSYMHDIFGPDVIEIFDMKYDPSEKLLKKSET